MKHEKLFQELIESLPIVEKAYSSSQIDTVFRTIDEAKKIIDLFCTIVHQAEELFDKHHSLKTSFEKDFGPYDQLLERDHIYKVAFFQEYLFPENEVYFLGLEEKVSQELMDGYRADFSAWTKEAETGHEKTQTFLKENFELQTKMKELDCHCIKCHADYKAKVRDYVYKTMVARIEAAEEELEDVILQKDLNYLSGHVGKLKKDIDRELQKIRYRLKKGSFNKLSNEIKSQLKLKLSYESSLGKIYKERLLSYFYGQLDEMELKSDFISPEEFDRFFLQMGMDIWRSPSFLRREFEKLVKAVASYKRKDISAGILRDYLGEFWVHSKARRKNRKIIYHMGPTNSGKTWNAIEALSKAQKGCYLAPLRLLASELYDTLNDKGVKTTLLTGEEVIELEGATHYSSTIEMARMNEEFECVVIDEIQMITDPSRGWAWTRALINIDADEVHVCGDHSVFDLVEKILELTGDTLVVQKYERMTKLEVMKKPIKLIELQANDALIVFSRRNALKFKRDLENLKFKVSIVYGRLGPEVRREQARKFDEGETDIMVSTDAIAMGMNLPVKRIVFSTLAKYYDSKEHFITDSEIKQIAGRAGRYGRFPKGFVTTLQNVEDGIDRLEEAMASDLPQSKYAMVGPDLEIFRSVNQALEDHSLATLSLSEFLRLFNTMHFKKPFYCVDLKEMIEITEMVESADEEGNLSDAEVFGFACAPVNLGLIEHVQYFLWILSHYVKSQDIHSEAVNDGSDDIDYLEQAIKCVELYQWLARHFQNKNFSFDQDTLIENKSMATEKLNKLLSEKTTRRCSSCGCKLPDDNDFNICEECFSARRTRWRHKKSPSGNKDSQNRSARPAKKSKASGSGASKNRRRRRPKAKSDAFNKG